MRLSRLCRFIKSSRQLIDDVMSVRDAGQDYTLAAGDCLDAEVNRHVAVDIEPKM